MKIYRKAILLPTKKWNKPGIKSVVNMKKEERTGVSTAAATPQPYRAKPISAFDACSTAIPYKKWKGVFYYLAEDVERERKDWEEAFHKLTLLHIEAEKDCKKEFDRAEAAEKKLAELQKLLEYNIHFKDKAEARATEAEKKLAEIERKRDIAEQNLASDRNGVYGKIGECVLCEDMTCKDKLHSIPAYLRDRVFLAEARVKELEAENKKLQNAVRIAVRG